MSERRFLVAKNPELGSSLPFLVRFPIGSDGLVLKARETWPRTSKVYSHRAAAGEWHDGLEIVEDVGVRSCVRKGIAIDLVLDRGKEHRSEFVFTRMKRGREGIFWQSAKTTTKARTVPLSNCSAPEARPANASLETPIDDRRRRVVTCMSPCSGKPIRVRRGP